MALLISAPGANLSLTNKAGKTAEQLARYLSLNLGFLNLGFVPVKEFINGQSYLKKGAIGVSIWL